jgi:hypothetical protein
MTLAHGIYLSPKHGDMVVVVGNDGHPRPLADDFHSLVSHKGSAESLASIWQIIPAKVVPADAIVIERGDLPHVEVTEMGDLDVLGEVVAMGDEASHRDIALTRLAAADYLAAHPPVDRYELEALANALGDALRETTDPIAIARDLLTSGAIQVKRSEPTS